MADDEGPNWFAAGKKILVNYNIPARTFWNGFSSLNIVKYSFTISKNILLRRIFDPQKETQDSIRVDHIEKN